MVTTSQITDRLIAYFRAGEIAAEHRRLIEATRGRIAALDKELEHGTALPSSGVSAAYGGRLAVSGSISDPTATRAELLADQRRVVGKELERLRQRIANLQAELDTMEEQNIITDCALRELESTARELLKGKLHERKTNLVLGIAFDCDESSIRKRIKDALQRLAGYFSWHEHRAA